MGQVRTGWQGQEAPVSALLASLAPCTFSILLRSGRRHLDSPHIGFCSFCSVASSPDRCAALFVPQGRLSGGGDYETVA